MTYKEVDKILRKDGWKLVRITGSHHQYKKPGVNYTPNVPYHGNKACSFRL
jgi:predicted RNA binding protein YcfA (HicA-like mRNA interferase family)